MDLTAKTWGEATPDHRAFLVSQLASYVKQAYPDYWKNVIYVNANYGTWCCAAARCLGSTNPDLVPNGSNSKLMVLPFNRKHELAALAKAELEKELDT